jgi:16S rRNA (adenine1518-N6/adenine1519-N6)-dimethyltransferase
MHARELLQRFGYRPKKRLGQNFLTDSNAAARIAQLVVDSGQARVLEIGAGTGSLTHALLEAHASVTALELDENMMRILRSRDDLAGATLVQADAMTYDYAGFAAGEPWTVAGNLPYHIATALVLQLIEMHDGPQTLVVMMQKDVVDRLRAKPGTRAYGSLSVAVQYAMSVERAFTLSPRAFYPQPKVDSSVVLLQRRDRPGVTVVDEARFWQVVRGAFAYRRKTLANSLSLAMHIERAAVTDALRKLDYDTEIRGEQLAIGDFAKIADALPAG